MKIKDYLLCFDDRAQALTFGGGATTKISKDREQASKYESIAHEKANGIGSKFVQRDERGEDSGVKATHAYAMAVIGPWIQVVGEDKEGNPITESDGKHWVLIRDLEGLEVPEGAAKHIVWTSDEGERPKDAPQDAWADEAVKPT